MIRNCLTKLHSERWSKNSKCGGGSQPAVMRSWNKCNDCWRALTNNLPLLTDHGFNGLRQMSLSLFLAIAREKEQRETAKPVYPLPWQRRWFGAQVALQQSLTLRSSKMMVSCHISAVARRGRRPE